MALAQFIKVMAHGDSIREYLWRVGFASLIFLGSLVVTAGFVGAGLGSELLAGVAVGEGSLPYKIFQLLLIISFIGVASVVPVCGAFVAAWEALASTWDFIRMSRI